MPRSRSRSGIIGWWVSLSMSHPAASLAVILAVTALSLIPVFRLKLNPDLGALLPQDTESTSRLDKATRRIGGTDLFAVTAEGPSPDLNIKAVDYLAGRMKGWRECLWLAVERRFDSLEKKALLFVPGKDLEELTGAIRDQIEYETCARSPMCVNLEEKKTPDLQELYARILRTSIVGETGSEGMADELLQEGDGPRGAGRFVSRDGRVAALLARLSEPATNIDFAKMIRKRIDGLVKGMPAELSGKVSINVRGAYDATREYEIIAKESSIVSIFSMGIMFVLTLFFFSQKRSLAIILGPLVIAAIWTLCFASLAYGELNSITAFIVGILLGMGIDYAIHVQRRFMEEALATEDEAGAMVRGIRMILTPILVAAATTIGSLLTLRMAHFRGFREFGTIAAAGIVFSFLAAVTVVPPLNALFSKVRKIRRGRFLLSAQGGHATPLLHPPEPIPAGSILGSVGTPPRCEVNSPTPFPAANAAGSLSLAGSRAPRTPETGGALDAARRAVSCPPPSRCSGRAPSPLERLWSLLKHQGDLSEDGEPGRPAGRRARVISAVVITAVVALTALIVPYAAKISFETDFKKFRAPGVGQLEQLEEAIGTGRANPLIILGSGEEQMRRIHLQLGEKYRQQNEAGGGKLISGFLTVASVVPDLPQQEQRLGKIEELEKVLRTKILGHVKGASREKIDKLRELAAVESPITFDDLPFWARSLLTEKDGRTGRIGYIYPAIDRWSAGEVSLLRSKYDALYDGKKKVEIASSSFVFLDVISVVKRDARSVGILASLVIFLILLIDLRSVLGALVCFGTLGGAILWTLALMRLTGVNIGVYNLLVLPTLMGIGIDASVYLWHRWKQVGARRLRYLMSSTGMSVIMALVTTAAGFSGLLLSIHPGLRSIAYFALPGAGLIIVFSFVLLPAFFVLNSK